MYQIEFILTDKLQDNEQGDPITKKEILVVSVIDEFIVQNQTDDKPKFEYFDAFIKSVDSNGFAIVTFNHSTLISPKLFTMEQVDLKQIIQVRVMPGEGQDISKLGITNFTLTQSGENELALKVNFENPIFIS